MARVRFSGDVLGSGAGSGDSDEKKQKKNKKPDEDEVRNALEGLGVSGANSSGDNSRETEKARQRGSFGSSVDDEPRHATESDSNKGKDKKDDQYRPNNSAENAAYNAGKFIVDSATGGNAEEWRSEFWKQEGSSLAEERENLRRELQYGNDGGGDIAIPLPGGNRLNIGGSTVSTLASTNTAARVGFDALFDNPTGPNVQDAGTGASTGLLSTYNKARNRLTGTSRDEDISKQDLADTAQSAEADLNEFNKGLGSGYQSAVDAAGLGDNWFATNLDEAVGTGFEWFVADAGEAAFTATTGVDAETGETEARAEPADLLDSLLFGAGKLSKGVRGITKATKSDEAVAAGAKGADEVAQSGKGTTKAAQGTDEATSSAAGAAGLGALATAVLGGKGAKAVGKYTSWIDEAAKTTDEVATGTSKVDEGVGSLNFGEGVDDTVGSLDGLDEFDALPRGIDTGDEAFRYTEDLSDTSFVMDEGVEAGARAGDESTSINAVMDEASGGGKFTLSDAGGVTDDAASRLSSAFDDVFRATDNTLDDATVSTVKSGDEGTSLTDDILRTSDDTAGDASDDVVRGTGETTSGGGGGTIRNWWDNLSNRWKFGLPAFLGGGLLLGQFTDIGIDGPDDSPRDPGPAGQERYRAESAKSYSPFGVLFKVQKGSDTTEWKTMGYGLILGRGDGTFGMSGQWLTLSEQARPVKATPVAGEASGKEWVPKPRFGNIGAADDAYERFLSWLRERARPEGGEDTPSPGTDPRVDGRLTAPDAVKQGEQFNANWEATLTGQESQVSGRLTLAIATEGGLVPLEEDDFSLGGASNSDSGTFQVPSGWTAVSPGSYAMYAVVQNNGEAGGALAKTTIEVVGADDGSKASQGSAWGDPELARELPRNWYLFVQTKEDGSGETRFLIVGRKEGGDYIYLHADGSARTEAYFFGTVEQAGNAFEKWGKRLQSGNLGDSEVPTGSASRPRPEQVKKDAAAADEGTTQGLVGRLARSARNNPVMFAGGTAVALAVGYYIYTEGM